MFLYDFEGAKKLLEEAGFKKNSEADRKQGSNVVGFKCPSGIFCRSVWG